MRGFSDEERERIRNELIETGREQLLAFGPERTRVKDITDPVGIAKPTFYQFFDSKGELYLEIFSRESERFGAQLRSDLAAIDDPREGLERLFTTYVEFIEQNPDVQQVMSNAHPRELFRNVPPEKIERVRQEWHDAIIPAVESLQENSNGPLAEYDPRLVLGLLRPVGLMHVYKERGTTRSEADFERIQDAHIRTLVRGLTLEGTDSS